MTTTIIIPRLTTERLVLRAPDHSDVDAFAAFSASPEARFVGGPMKRHYAWRYLAGVIGHWHLRGFGRWIVEGRETGARLGLVGLHYPDDWPEPEIGWVLFEGAEGRGIAFEAARASRAFAYDHLGWTTAVSLIAAGNRRSLALAARLGAVYELEHDHPDYGRLQIHRHPGPGEVADADALIEVLGHDTKEVAE